VPTGEFQFVKCCFTCSRRLPATPDISTFCGSKLMAGPAWAPKPMTEMTPQVQVITNAAGQTDE